MVEFVVSMTGSQRKMSCSQIDALDVPEAKFDVLNQFETKEWLSVKH